MALLSTLWAWLVRPGRSAQLFDPEGSVGRAMVLVACSLGISAFSLWCVGRLLGNAVWGPAGTAPVPVMLSLDLIHWLERSGRVLLAIGAGVGMFTDWGMLALRASPGAVLRAWAATASVFVTAVPVAILVAGATGLRFLGLVDSRALVVVAGGVLPLWFVVLPVGWLIARWHSLPWAASMSKVHARIVVFAGPLGCICLFVVLSVLFG